MKNQEKTHYKFRKWALSSCAVLSLICNVSVAQEAMKTIYIPAQDLSEALAEFGHQTGTEIAFTSDAVKGFSSNAISGEMSVDEALNLLLANTQLHFVKTKDNVVYVKSGFQTISYNTEADYESNLGTYEGDESQNEVNAFELDEIIVTASRRTQKLQDVPMSMTSVNPEEFIAVGLTSLEDVIDYTPGVNFNSGGQSGQGHITMRAVSQESAIPVTAIYVDDVPLTTSTPFAFGAQIFLDGLLGDLERVEVIKGPQGTLYGASSMGGIIRYITKDPALEEVRGSASVDISTTKEGGTSQLYRGMVSVPIVEDRFGITVAGFYNDKAGFIDRLDPFTLEIADKDYNASEVYGVSVTGLWKLSEDASVRVSGLYQKTKAYGTDGVRFNVADPDNIVLVPQHGDYQIATVDPGFRNLEYKKADVTFKYAFDWAEFISVTGYAQHVNPSVFDQITGNEAIADFFAGSPPGTSQSLPAVFSAESEKFIQEFRLSSLNNDTFEWQVGLFYTKDETDNSQLLTVEPQGVLLADARFPTEYEEKAAFANATYYVTPDLDVTAGMRYSESSLDADFNFGGILLAPLVGKFSASENVTTYMFNARWRVRDTLSLYARVASGYRPSFVNIPGIDAITGQVASSIVKSDSLWSYEVGAKGSVLGGKLSYDLALWAMQWNDFQAALSLSGVNTDGNAGVGMSSHGFEGTFNAFVTDQLSMQATVAYTKSTLDEDSAELGAIAGEATRGLPDWTASIKANYDYTIGDIDATTTFGVRYVGKFNTAYLGDVSQGIGFGLNRLFPIEEVVLADLSTSFTRGNFTLSLYATNLFNNYAFTSGGTGLDGLGSPVTANAAVAKPRTIGASIAVSF